VETDSAGIDYRDDLWPEPATIAELYRIAPLERPIDDLGRIERMYASANLVLTAWDSQTLVGILRAWSDGGFFGYIADLAVHPDYQHQGIGRELLRRAVASNTEVTFFLHAAPIARDYYPHIGWLKMDNAWGWRRER
jgi:ribosomal protein S18 acetylase RimI-like enzyme